MNQQHSRADQVSNAQSVITGVITKGHAKGQQSLANRLAIISISLSS